MELVKNNWTTKDFEELKAYCKTLKGDQFNCEWEQRIINTKLECFARTSTKARTIANQIKKGNYMEFLEKIQINTLLDSLIYAHLMNCIKDENVYCNLLDKYVLTIDNWASCDTLKFDKIKNVALLLEISDKYIKSSLPFVRRVGINVYFDLIKDEKYLDRVFKVLDSLKDEKEYYVNMVGAWLLAECFAKHRDKTLAYFKDNSTNAFIINKGISKCRDSYRITKEDKDYLLSFKK